MTPPNIDTLFAELVSWLQLLNAAQPPTYHLYALVDGALDPSLLGEAERSHAEWRGLYPEKMLESRTPEMGPFLVALTPGDAGHDAFMHSLLQRSQGLDLVIWVASRQPIDVLAAHGHAYAEVKLPDGRSALLRHYDPSILEILVPMFDARQRADFLAAAREYRYWRAGWQSIAGTDAVTVPEAAADWIKLTPAQFELLSTESFAETLYHRLRDELLPPANAVDSRDSIRTIRALLARAIQTHGLNNQSDLAYFSLIGLNVHPWFDLHEVIAKVLAEQRGRDVSLAKKLADVDSSVWDALLRQRGA